MIFGARLMAIYSALLASHLVLQNIIEKAKGESRLTLNIFPLISNEPADERNATQQAMPTAQKFVTKIKILVMTTVKGPGIFFLPSSWAISHRSTTLNQFASGQKYWL